MAGGERFADQVPQHTAAMRRAAAALVGWDNAEDAAQEAIVRAWQVWATLRAEDNPRPWLLKITVNICLEWRRGRFGKQQALSQPLLDDDAGELATIAFDPGTSDHTGSLDLRNAVNALRPEQRIVVALRYYGGLDATEIGEALGVPATTVRTRLRRGLHALRVRLETTERGVVVHSGEVVRDA